MEAVHDTAREDISVMVDLEKLLVKTPSWIVFCVLLIPLLIGEFIPFGISILFFVLFGWLTLVGVTLQKKADHYLKKSTFLIKISFLFVIIYIITLEVGWNFFSSRYFFVFNFTTMCCVGYLMYFVARSLVVAESKQILSLDRYIGTFLLLWFFPIGVWFIHPRIRKVMNKGGSNQESTRIIPSN